MASPSPPTDGSAGPIYFDGPAAFRRWLQANHRTATELWVGYYKKATGRPTLTWPQSVDEALCFGWIDGIRRSVDADRYVIRFTPRRPGSIWSLVNVRRVAELTKTRRMRAAGLAAFAARDAAKSGVYSFEQREQAALTPDMVAQFKRRRAAWSFFAAQPPGYRRLTAFYVMSAKKEETRARRLQALIDASAAGERIGLFKRAEPKT